MGTVEIVGRSSSHFTRVVRLFIAELGLPHTFRPVLDLTSTDLTVYGGNPAMKVPVLVDEEGLLVGTENICQALVQRAGKTGSVVLRGAVPHRTVANVEELILHVMNAEVTILMGKVNGTPTPAKVLKSLRGSLDYLEKHIDEALAALPADRQLSFLEASLFAVLEHLPFRELMDVTPWTRLGAFADAFRERPCAKATPYFFDAA